MTGRRKGSLSVVPFYTYEQAKAEMRKIVAQMERASSDHHRVVVETLRWTSSDLERLRPALAPEVELVIDALFALNGAQIEHRREQLERERRYTAIVEEISRLLTARNPPETASATAAHQRMAATRDTQLMERVVDDVKRGEPAKVSAATLNVSERKIVELRKRAREMGLLPHRRRPS